MYDFTKMQDIVRTIKANYRDKIHQLRWQEKNDIAQKINTEFDKIFTLNSKFKFNNIWDNTIYTVIEIDKYYIYYSNSINKSRIKKDEAIFRITPIKD